MTTADSIPLTDVLGDPEQEDALSVDEWRGWLASAMVAAQGCVDSPEGRAALVHLAAVGAGVAACLERARAQVPIIQTHGIRHDVDDLFRQAHIIDQEHLPHTPFLALITAPGSVTVQRVSSAAALVGAFPDETRVLVQWPGKSRSDFFETSVGAVRAALAEAARAGEGEPC